MSRQTEICKAGTAAILSAVIATTLVLSRQDAGAQLQRPEYDLWSAPPAKIETWQEGARTLMHEQRTARHRRFIQDGLPVEYRALNNPYPVVGGAIKQGRSLYARHCLDCHGPDGLGDGIAGQDLAPSPALLAYLTEEPEAADGFLLWTISEGGAEFGSGMPAFKSQLEEQEIWSLVTFLRAGLPGDSP